MVNIFRWFNHKKYHLFLLFLSHGQKSNKFVYLIQLFIDWSITYCDFTSQYIIDQSMISIYDRKTMLGGEAKEIPGIPAI
jgi:hypothetical protein